MKRTKAEKDELVLDAVRYSFAMTGRAPTLAELMKITGIHSYDSVMKTIVRLEDENKITRSKSDKHRNIILNHELGFPSISELVSVPIVTQYKKNVPVSEYQTDIFPIPPDMAPPGEIIGGICSDDSMREASVFGGDIVLASISGAAKRNEFVLCGKDGKILVRQLMLVNNKWVLADGAGRYAPCSEFDIIGKVFLLARFYKE